MLMLMLILTLAYYVETVLLLLLLLKGGDFIFVIVIDSIFVGNVFFLSCDYIRVVFVRKFMSLLDCFVLFAQFAD